jgi:phosphoglycolate phosphatase
MSIVFDLDGTLVESAPAIRDVANELMAELDLPKLDLTETRQYVGNGAGRFLECALEARSAYVQDEFPERLSRFMAHYAKAPPEANKPMPGCEAAMRELAATGHRLAICTNKPMVPTRALINALGWNELISVVIAGDSLPERKPHPAPLLKAMAELKQPFTLYVGDSDVDAATAEAARVPFFLFTEGYRKLPVSELKHAAKFQSFEELPRLVTRFTVEA